MGALRCRFVSYPSDGFLSPSLAVHVSLATGKTSVTGKCTRRNMELLVPWDINIAIAFRYQEEMQLLRFLRERAAYVCVCACSSRRRLCCQLPTVSRRVTHTAFLHKLRIFHSHVLPYPNPVVEALLLLPCRTIFLPYSSI